MKIHELFYRTEDAKSLYKLGDETFVLVDEGEEVEVGDLMRITKPDCDYTYDIAKCMYSSEGLVKLIGYSGATYVNQLEGLPS